MVIVTHYEGSFLGDLDLTFYAFHDFLIERKVGWGASWGAAFLFVVKTSYTWED